jgi:hypothetical protein
MKANWTHPVHKRQANMPSSTAAAQRQPIRLVGFGSLDLRLGDSIRVYGGGGRASATHRASSYKKLRIRLDRLLDGRTGFEAALLAKHLDLAIGNPDLNDCLAQRPTAPIVRRARPPGPW